MENACENYALAKNDLLDNTKCKIDKLNSTKDKSEFTNLDETNMSCINY
jgi:hypothetical protein